MTRPVQPGLCFQGSFGSTAFVQSAVGKLMPHCPALHLTSTQRSLVMFSEKPVAVAVTVLVIRRWLFLHRIQCEHGLRSRSSRDQSATWKFCAGGEAGCRSLPPAAATGPHCCRCGESDGSITVPQSAEQPQILRGSEF